MNHSKAYLYIYRYHPVKIIKFMVPVGRSRRQPSESFDSSASLSEIMGERFKALWIHCRRYKTPPKSYPKHFLGRYDWIHREEYYITIQPSFSEIGFSLEHRQPGGRWHEEPPARGVPLGNWKATFPLNISWHFQKLEQHPGI